MRHQRSPLLLPQLAELGYLRSNLKPIGGLVGGGPRGGPFLRPGFWAPRGGPAVFVLAPPSLSPPRILLQAGPVLIQTAGRFARCPCLSFSALFSQMG